MTDADRIPCSILGCRRTAPKEGRDDVSEIICGRHWRMASREARKAHSEAKREFLAIWAPLEPICDRGGLSAEQVALLDRLYDAELAAWQAVVAEAFEAVAGIA